MPDVVYHGAETHAPNGSDPVAAVYEIKLFGDDEAVTAGDGRFVFEIPEDCGGTRLRAVRIYVTTVSSSGIVRVQLHNIDTAVDMLSTRVQVDAGEKSSKTASTSYVIDSDDTSSSPDLVSEGDQIRVDIDDGGTGAMGLGIALWFAA